MGTRRPGFFQGATNFEISGGTFNDIAGDLNQYHTYHFAAEFNNIQGDSTRVNSPTIVNYHSQPPPFIPNRSHTEPAAAWRGAGRGIRRATYNTGRPSEQPQYRAPHSRNIRIQRDDPELRSAGSNPPSTPRPHFSPSMVDVDRRDVRARNYPQRSEPSGSFLNRTRHDNRRAYVPTPPPALYRNTTVEDEDESSNSEDEEDKSDAGNSTTLQPPSPSLGRSNSGMLRGGKST
ncbi:hypothetical protein B0H10DRAFT_2123934 [Mycena sp. CBHHK59/15]|nr:hypothetical protein B0H10DRAFT_2123934 [Mycena sp. CBHHK59/15]